MKKYIHLLTISLLISLFIYSFYRTEKTLINQIFIFLFTKEVYLLAKTVVVTHLSLNDYIIYSLPEGLWIFCITITWGFHFPGCLLNKDCTDSREVDGATVIVSKGVGDTFPVRWNCAREVIKIRIV